MKEKKDYPKVQLETIFNKNNDPEIRAKIEVAYYSQPIYLKEKDLALIIEQVEKLKIKLRNTIL